MLRHSIVLLGVVCLGVALSSCSFFRPPRIEKVVYYTAETGDTLGAISAKFGVGVGTIEDLNDLSDPRDLRAGQVLRIPYQGSLPAKGVSTPNKSSPSHSSKGPSGWDPNAVKRVPLGGAERYVGKLFWPLGGEKRLSSPFGRRWFSFHEGVDIAGPIGIPIYAAHDGVVAYSDDGLRGYGNLVIVKGDGILTVYAHNRSNIARKGERVRKGEKIAVLGQSGKATGPHLHFEVRVKGAGGKNVAVDPMIFFVH